MTRVERIMEKTGGKPHITFPRSYLGGCWIYKNCPPKRGAPATFHARTYPSFAVLLKHEPLPS